MIGEKLTDSEVAGGSISPSVFPNSICIDWYPRLPQRLAEASSTMAMVARRWHVVVLRPSSAVTSLGEHDYSSRVT